jgi:DHA1 family bicyclomycin/chloramphenicol resistance-like MFS transporter
VSHRESSETADLQPAQLQAPRSTPRPRFGPALFVTIGALTAFGPLATDLYLPGLPDMAAALDTTPSLAQLTISICLVGLALGQLVAGPLSDSLGRRRPLLVGVALFAVASFLCALAPSIWVLLGLRLVQGLTGAAGIVIARAIVRDTYSGVEAARVFSQLMLVMGLAPIAAPLLGGQILQFTDWRGVFVALGVIGLGLFTAALLIVPETNPPESRHVGGLGSQLRQMGRLVLDRHFLVYLSIAGLQGATLFTYISLSTFVLRGTYGISPQTYSFIFATNAVGMVVGAQLNATFVRRHGPLRLLRCQLVLAFAGALALTVDSIATHSLLGVLIPLFVVMASFGGLAGNVTALALTPYGHAAGAASALLGNAQFLFGAIVPPVVSLLGTHSWVMGTTMVTTSGVALLLATTGIRQRPSEPVVA